MPADIVPTFNPNAQRERLPAVTAEEQELRKAEARYQRAARSLEAARISREDAIRKAAGSMSTRQIAAHVSVTAQRVQQIIRSTNV